MSGIGGVWLPGSGDSPREDFENDLERACTIAVYPGGMDAMNVLVDIESYRTQTVAQIGKEPSAPGLAERAAQWLDAEDRSELPLPDADCELIAMLDDAVIQALRSDGLSADDVVTVYDEWTEQTKREFEAAHGLEEGWIDEAGDAR